MLIFETLSFSYIQFSDLEKCVSMVCNEIMRCVTGSAFVSSGRQCSTTHTIHHNCVNGKETIIEIPGVAETEPHTTYYSCAIQKYEWF